MSQYNILQAIYMSFYSKRLYKDVATNWSGKAYLYLLLLLTLSWVGVTYTVQHNLNQGYQKDSDAIVTQIPVLTITNGKVSVPEKHPYFITDPETHETVVVIDTTGKYTTIEQTKGALLVTDTEVISKPKNNETKIYQLPNTLNVTLNPQVINGYVGHFIGFIWIFFLVLFVLGSFIYRLLQALVYSVIGKLFNLMLGANVTYGQIMQIMMVAITPTIVAATIFDSFHIVFAHQLLLYFVLAMVYLFYGISANKN